MSTKKIVLRQGVTIVGSLSSGTGDPILTKDATTSEIGQIPSIDTSTYLSSSLNNGYILVGNGSNIATPVLPSGDIVVSNAGVLSIGTGVITNSHIAANALIAYSKLALTGAIVNNDISAVANISRAKLASGNAYRLLINDGAGLVAEQSALAADFVLVTDASGLPVPSATSTTTLSYLDIPSSLTGLLADKLTYTSTPATGDILYYNGSWLSLAAGTNGHVLTLTAGLPVWAPSTANGIPAGGSANQYLSKIDGVDYNVQWSTLNLAKVTDVTALAADVNLLGGLAAYGITTAELQYLNGLNSNIQTQITALDTRSPSLASGYMWVGTISGNATTLAPGSTGAILTMSGGVPTWSLNSLQYAEVTISSAELLALFTTPKTLIAAPGAGKMIDIISIMATSDYNSIAYTTTTSFFVTYGTTGANVHSTGINFGSAFDTHTKVELSQIEFNTATMVNTPISAYCVGANPTAGNGTVKVYIMYRIITV